MNVQLPVNMDKQSFFAWARGREGRYELAGGRVVMMTGGTISHGLIVGNLFEMLRAQLNRGTLAVLTDFGVDVGPSTVRYPDVIVVDRRGTRAKDLVARAPMLVAEILSPSSEKLDLGKKAVEYLRLPSLPAYFVLLQDEVKAWVYFKGSQQLPDPETVTGDGATISIPALGIDLPLAEIYAGVEFD